MEGGEEGGRGGGEDVVEGGECGGMGGRVVVLGTTEGVKRGG